jgi:hypothetical protein
VDSLKAHLDTATPKPEFCEVLVSVSDVPGDSPFYELVVNHLEWYYLLNQKKLSHKLVDGEYVLIMELSENQLIVVIGKTDYSKTIDEFLYLSSSTNNGTQYKSVEQSDHRLDDAKRIQDLILPTKEKLGHAFTEHFVYLKPQDTVGGDFYWLKSDERYVYFALVDCTGHSVEGAMASMVCSSLLDQALDVYGTSGLDLILKRFYDLLGEYEVDDLGLSHQMGAELALVRFDLRNNVMEFCSSGVRGYLDNGKDSVSLRARKSVMFDPTQLAVVNYSLDAGAKLYLFSDGLTDQFDLTDQKKMGFERVRNIIVNEKSFSSSYYEEALNQWMGSNLQYDDISIVGLKI